MTQKEIEDMAERNRHIPTDEIHKDIMDTQVELRVMSLSRSEVSKREDFIERLQMILDYRKGLKE